MPRSLAKPPENWRQTLDAGRQRERENERTYPIEVVTPMFGGGVEPGISDPITLIRPTTIRGHLRFWWRATRGAAFADAKEMKEAECRIWGSTEQASYVVVTVAISSRGEARPCAYLPPEKNFPKFEKNHPPYALFPFQGDKKKGKPIGKGTSRATFDLSLEYPLDLDADVQSALWAWINFGGIGARTRRGCGSLACPQLAPDVAAGKENWEASLGTWLSSHFAQYGIHLPDQTRAWPTLSSRWLVCNKPMDPMVAWDDAVASLRLFRQGDNVGRAKGSQSNRPGRSYWPEPETIRRVANQRLPKHARISEIPDDCYPRAEFGLPIVFHFKDAVDKGKGTPTDDPDETELLPVVDGAVKNRMASRLIIKPLVLATGKAIPLVMLLDGPKVDEVGLRRVRDSRLLDRREATKPTATGYRKSPMESRSACGSAIEAFLAFLQETNQGFQEIHIQEFHP